MALRIIGNWKMNVGGHHSARELACALKSLIGPSDVLVSVAPPATALCTVAEELKLSALTVGVQNVHWCGSGAYTGEISPESAKECGASFAIVGHSERRHIFLESNEMIALRLQGALKYNLDVVLCVGEELSAQENGSTLDVLNEQLTTAFNETSAEDAQKIIVAYEPVWAIGTGKVASLDQIESAHRFIREWWQERFAESNPPTVLYGGSVTPSSFPEIIVSAEVSGALVGGASLKPDLFSDLVTIAQASLKCD